MRRGEECVPPTRMGLRIHGDDRHDEEDREADDRRKVPHDAVEVTEHLDRRQLAHPHERLHLEEDLEAASAPARALLENLPQVLGRLARREHVPVVPAVPPRRSQLQREQKVLSDALGRKPSDRRQGGGAHCKIGAAADGRAPRIQAGLAAEEEG